MFNAFLYAKGGWYLYSCRISLTCKGVFFHMFTHPATSSPWEPLQVTFLRYFLGSRSVKGNGPLANTYRRQCCEGYFSKKLQLFKHSGSVCDVSTNKRWVCTSTNIKLCVSLQNISNLSTECYEIYSSAKFYNPVLKPQNITRTHLNFSIYYKKL